MVNRAEELIADLEAEIAQRDARIAELEHKLDQKVEFMRQLAKDGAKLDDQIAALKAQQPSAGVVDDRAAFERHWYAQHYTALNSMEAQRHFNAGIRHARLNPCRAQSVPDVSAMARVLADRCADACSVDRDDYWKQYGEDCIEDVRAMLAAPSAKKEPGDE